MSLKDRSANSSPTRKPTAAVLEQVALILIHLEHALQLVRNASSVLTSDAESSTLSLTVVAPSRP